MIRDNATQRENFEKRLDEQIEKKFKEQTHSEAVRKSLEIFERIYKGESPTKKRQ